MPLRDALRPVVAHLLASSELDRAVSLDAISDAIGVRAVSSDDVDAIIDALEQEGRRVGHSGATSSGPATEDLRRILPTARALSARVGRAPSASEIGAELGISVERVRDALAFAALLARVAR